ncbi:Shugoshin [Rhynchospora pubera]|uniref:Shugoshin n=1 Tax=Rhynchospora pubera TaxID=906938 RepID=A0AAV8DWP5_9POAL|nr:Shugoshin [Rhynchospora pubera]
MEGGGHFFGAENKAPSRASGVNNSKLGARRQSLMDLSNIVRENRNSVIYEKSYDEVMKENAQLLKNIGEAGKMMEAYKEEIEKLNTALQGARQQNWQLAESNSQMLAELNIGKDRLKNLQHELHCTTLVLTQKKLEFQEKQRLIKQLQQQIKVQGKQVDLEGDASVGTKRKKTSSESNSQISGQVVRQEAPKRKLDDRKLIRRQSIAKPQTISSSNVQSVKAASSSISAVSLHEEGRTSTRRASIIPNNGFTMEEAPDDSSKLDDDKGVNTVDVKIISSCAIKAEPETEPEIAEPSFIEKETTGDDVTTSFQKNATSLSTEQQVAADATDEPQTSTVPVATAPLTAQDVHLEAPRQKLGDRKSIRRRSIATVPTVSSSYVQSVKTASCSGINTPLHELGSKSTRRRSIKPSSGHQMEEAARDSCKIVDHDNASTENNSTVPVCTVPNTEHGTNCISIKEENTDVKDCIIVYPLNHRPSLAAARRSSLSRPLPLRRAVEKVASYREQPVNVKMRRDD